MVKRHCAKEGFPMDGVKVFEGIPSSVCFVLAGPTDRGFVSCYSSTDRLSTEHLRERADVMEGSSHLHIGGYFNLKGLHNKDMASLVGTCREKGLSISLNLQYDATEKWTGEGESLRDLLPHVGLLFVNEGEAKSVRDALVHVEGADPSPKALCEVYPGLTVVMTLGKDGVEVLRAGKAGVRVDTTPVAQVVDATGAGDAFIGGFLSVWLKRESSVGEEEALRRACDMGCAVAGAAVGRVGAC